MVVFRVIGTVSFWNCLCNASFRLTTRSILLGPDVLYRVSSMTDLPSEQELQVHHWNNFNLFANIKSVGKICTCTCIITIRRTTEGHNAYPDGPHIGFMNLAIRILLITSTIRCNRMTRSQYRWDTCMLKLNLAVGVTKVPFGNFPVRKMFYLAKLHLTIFKSHSYLTGFTAAALPRYLPNIHMIFNSKPVFW